MKPQMDGGVRLHSPINDVDARKSGRFSARAVHRTGLVVQVPDRPPIQNGAKGRVPTFIFYRGNVTPGVEFWRERKAEQIRLCTMITDKDPKTQMVRTQHILGWGRRGISHLTRCPTFFKKVM